MLHYIIGLQSITYMTRFVGRHLRAWNNISFNYFTNLNVILVRFNNDETVYQFIESILHNYNESNRIDCNICGFVLEGTCTGVRCQIVIVLSQ